MSSLGRLPPSGFRVLPVLRRRRHHCQRSAGWCPFRCGLLCAAMTDAVSFSQLVGHLTIRSPRPCLVHRSAVGPSPPTTTQLSVTHEQAGIACADCHRVHAAVDAVRSRDGQASQCVGCHAGVGADMLKASSHPMRRNQLLCRDCHDPHGGEALLRDSAGNEACTRCHAELRGPFLWEHPPAAEDCGICHEPHGANQPSLLTRRAPQLCQACHSSVGHRSWPQLPSRPSDPGAEFLLANACLNCHAQVHGSNHPSGNLLRR